VTSRLAGAGELESSLTSSIVVGKKNNRIAADFPKSHSFKEIFWRISTPLAFHKFFGHLFTQLGNIAGSRVREYPPA